MTDPYKSNPGGPQYGPPGTGPEPNQYPQQDPYAQQQNPYAQQQGPYAQQQNPYGQQPYPQQQPYAAGYPPQGYPAPMPGYNPNDMEAPYGRDMYGTPFSDKQKIVAGLLQIFLGSFGVGRFYTGHTGMAIGQIAVTWLTCGIGAIWPLIDGIMMLMDKVPDSYGRPLRD